jgi:hypothetical protein
MGRVAVISLNGIILSSDSRFKVPGSRFYHPKLSLTSEVFFDNCNFSKIGKEVGS